MGECGEEVKTLSQETQSRRLCKLCEHNLRLATELDLGCGTAVRARTGGSARGDRLQPEGVVSRGDHGQRDGRAVATGVHVLGLKPCAQARVINFGLTLPEIGGQSTLDPKMVQLQFDGRNVLRKIAAHVI